MQNWYSQNNPFRSNGVAVGMMVGRAAGVRVVMEASVVDTAESTEILGVAAARPGNEQDVIPIPEISIMKKYRHIFQEIGLDFNPIVPPKHIVPHISLYFLLEDKPANPVQR
jgi:hypothetical protein